MHPFAAGIDIGANSVFVCAPFKGSLEVRECSTFTPDLKAMIRWLRSCGVTTCAMESTGVYWIPVYDLIESSEIEAVLVNAHHIKNVPGRKTDVKDCEWIQKLHSYGLLRGSFRPGKEILPLRAYTRLRSRLFEKAGQEVVLMHKALTQMNIRLNMVISDLTGSSGMKMIEAITNGEKDPKVLASFRDRQGLEGTCQEEHIFALAQSYKAYRFFHEQVLDCEKKIEAELIKISELNSDQPRTDSFEKEPKSRNKTIANQSAYYFNAPRIVSISIDLLEIPGIEANTMVKVLLEIGTDMCQWPTSKHFVSWLGLCPGNKVSGGKVLSSRTRKSSNKVAQALRMAANSLRCSKTALGGY